MLKKILHNILSGNRAAAIDRTGDEPLTPSRRIDSALGRSLRIRQVDAGSCNACEWECTALINPVYDIQRFGIDFVASPRHADMLLVTGPVSRQMELALKKTFDAIPEPRIVVACGDCAIDGGVYKGSYAVNDGAADVIPVDLIIPGCPPGPADISSALVRLMKTIRQKKR
ncbi:MAG: NADH-quinone oxidoreductase subunit NuoB [Nitrospirota bacterium]|nr:NADH-quinone oxidoreductase subunit NuoB [Nitrospirota bacterium]